MKKITLLLIILFSLNAKAQITTNGLIACYPFDNNTNDYSGYNNNGTIVGAVTPTTDRFGNPNSAYNFNNGHITIPSSTSLESPTNAITITSWIRVINNAVGYAPILCKTNNGTLSPFQYRAGISGSTIIVFGFQNSLGLSTDFSSSSTALSNNWQYISITYDGANIKYYLNGILVNSVPNIGQIFPDNKPLEIGRDAHGPIEYLDGDIDDLKIYNTALTDSEIYDLYTNASLCSNLSTDTCKTTQINLNTGVDANGNLLPIGVQDMNWKVTSIQNATPMPGFSLPYHPYTIPLVGGWYIPTNSRWINRVDSNIVYGGPTDVQVEYTRSFTTLTNDTFKIKFLLAGDNGVNYLKIDGIVYWLNPGISCYANQCTILNDSLVYLPAGCHDISAASTNAWGYIGTNGEGINIEGYIQSATGDSSILKQTCVTNTPPTLTANDTISYCTNCEPVSPNLTITSGLGCGNLDTVKVYFTSGYSQGQDTLQFIPQLGINSTFNAITGVLTLYGNANYGVWETVLRSVCYSSLVPNASQSNIIKNVVISLVDALYNPANGHYYELVNNPPSTDWSDARNKSAASSLLGAQGYLVNITDAAENAFVFSMINETIWIGATDSAVQNEWRWVTGCEGHEDSGQGRYFSNTGSSYNGNYVNWLPGNPSPWLGEHHASLFYPNNGWNDAAWNTPYAYVIEYGCAPLNFTGNIIINILPHVDTIINHIICQGSSFLGHQFAGVYKDTFASSTNVCDSIRTLNLEATYCPPCGVIINESFNTSSTLSNWAVSYNGNGGSIIINNGALNIHNNGGSNGYMGGADIVYLTPNYGGLLFNLQNKEIYYNINEVLLDSFPNNKHHLNAGSYVYNDANNWMRVFVFGKYYPYDFGNPYASAYLNNWSGHVVGILKSVGGALTMNFIDTLGFNDLYNLDFLLKNSGLNWEVKYKRSNQSTYTTYATNLPAIPTSTFSYRFQSGDGGFTTQNGFGDWQIHNFVVANTKKDTIINQTICQGDSVFGYNITGTWIDTFSSVNNCDSLRILNLTVNPTSSSTINQSICQGQNYLGYAITGIWIDTFTNANNCDSIRTLNLTVNPLPTIATSATQTVLCQGASTTITANGATTFIWMPGSLIGSSITVAPLTTTVYTVTGTNTATGCSNTSTRTITVNNNTFSASSVNDCDSFLWNGNIYITSGTYTHTTLNASGCIHNATLNLTINYSTTSTSTVTSCDFYSWNGNTYTTSGIYTFTSLNASGCPHTATLNLTINYSTTSTSSTTACDSYTWNGNTYTTSGIYTHTSLNASGCVHTATLNLTINYSAVSTGATTACDSYTWNGITYTTSGTYTFTSINASGCVHTATLNLTINNSSVSTGSITACDSYTWNGTTYTTSGTYISTSLNAAGCVNTVTLNLTINYSSVSTGSITACQSYTWNGTTIITSGTYTHTNLNASGCLNTDTLHLTINPLPTISISPSTTTICKGDSITMVASGAINYNWSPSIGLNITSGNLVNASPASTMVYTVVGVDLNGCIDSISKIVTVYNTYNNKDSIELCEGMNYTFGGQTITASGIYTNIFYTTTGCDSIIEMKVTVYEKPKKDFVLPSDICANETIEIKNTWQGQDAVYSWDFDGATILSQNGGNATVSWDSTGMKIITMTITPHAPCLPMIFKDTIEIHKPAAMIKIANNDSTFCVFDQITLSTYNVPSYIYEWNPPPYLISNKYSVTGELKEPITATVEVTDTFGCKAMASKFLNVTTCCKASLPNAFSPNGDGQNDVFKIIGEGKYHILDFFIVNRWGNIIFKTINANDAWDGTYRGVMQNMDMYFYYLVYECTDLEKRTLKGEIYLIR